MVAADEHRVAQRRLEVVVRADTMQSAGGGERRQPAGPVSVPGGPDLVEVDLLNAGRQPDMGEVVLDRRIAAGRAAAVHFLLGRQLVLRHRIRRDSVAREPGQQCGRPRPLRLGRGVQPVAVERPGIGIADLGVGGETVLLERDGAFGIAQVEQRHAVVALDGGGDGEIAAHPNLVDPVPEPAGVVALHPRIEAALPWLVNL